METLWEFVDKLAAYWSFPAGWFGFTFVGQFMKTHVWTKAAASRSRAMKFMRQTMAMHPVLAGMVLGSIPGIPVPPGITGRTAIVAYWTFLGILSSFSFHVVHQWVKKKYDIDLEDAYEDAIDPSMNPTGKPGVPSVPIPGVNKMPQPPARLPSLTARANKKTPLDRPAVKPKKK